MAAPSTTFPKTTCLPVRRRRCRKVESHEASVRGSLILNGLNEGGTLVATDNISRFGRVRESTRLYRGCVSLMSFLSLNDVFAKQGTLMLRTKSYPCAFEKSSLAHLSLENAQYRSSELAEIFCVAIAVANPCLDTILNTASGYPR